MTFEKLPPELSDRIDNKLKEAGDAWRAGDTGKAEAFRLEAWTLIPEPKFKWDYYPQTISRNFVLRYRETKQFEKAKQWLITMRQAYSPPDEASEALIGFLEGIVLFDAGELDDAFERFDQLYKRYKTRPFQGEDKKYLNFYLQRKKK